MVKVNAWRGQWVDWMRGSGNLEALCFCVREKMLLYDVLLCLKSFLSLSS